MQNVMSSVILVSFLYNYVFINIFEFVLFLFLILV